MTDEQRALASQWIDMAYGQAKQWSLTRPFLKEEFVSAAMTSLVEAARNYDFNVGKTFYTYLQWHLRHARKEVLRNNIPKGYRVTGCLKLKKEQLDRDRPKLVEWDASKDYATGTNHSGFADLEARDWVENHLSKLGPEHINICIQIYWYSRSVQEIAGEMGCARGDVERIRDESLAFLRSALESGDEEVQPKPSAPYDSRFGEVVKAMRLSRGLGEEEVARACGVTVAKLGCIENGTVRPCRKTAIAFAALFDKEPSLLLILSGYSSRENS